MLVSGGVAVSTLVFSAWNANRQRRHDRDMVRVTRNFAARQDLYCEIVEHVERLGLVVNRTETLLAPVTNAPELPPEDETVSLRARTAALASAQVNEAVTHSFSAFHSWQFQVSVFRVVKAKGDEQVREAAAELRLKAEEFHRRAEALVRIINTELDPDEPE